VSVVVNSLPSNTNVSLAVINPAITSVTPPWGSYGGTVIINGSGFGPSQGSGQVKFNTAAASVISWSDTQVSVFIPWNAASGPVSVTVAGIIGQSVPYPINSLVQVTDSLGNASSYTSASVGGAWTNIAGSGSGCSSCTVRGNVQQTLDSNGNVLTFTDELGHV